MKTIKRIFSKVGSSGTAGAVIPGALEGAGELVLLGINDFIF